MKKFVYTGGQQVMVSDLVLLPRNQTAHVKLILEPGSALAQAYSPPNGGIVLDLENGDCQMWPQANEDIHFLRRGDLMDFTRSRKHES